ncbi:MAG: 6-phosphogluconolactonase [Planctomycetaceae bacterium]|nr:6-phosphogluconolactonase [Planctomycetaceae bacterium]
MSVLEDKTHMIRVRDSEELAQQALEHFFEVYRQSLQQRDCFYTAISGGHTPVLFYKKLAQPEIYARFDWDKVQLFWVDERCVQPDGKDSNFGLAARTFLQSVPIPPQNVHRVSGEIENYRQAAKDYEEEIRRTMNPADGRQPVFDLIVLGMGADGHIGSIFPNTYALFDTDSMVRTVYRLEGGHSRITLTIPVLKAARDLMILVSGPEKAQTLKSIFNIEPDPVLYPVHALWPVLHKVTWIVDEAAAALLP